MTKGEKIAKLGKEITDRATVLLGKDKITPESPEYLGINSALILSVATGRVKARYYRIVCVIFRCLIDDSHRLGFFRFSKGQRFALREQGGNGKH